MDQHLNVFHSYRQGGSKEIEEEKILENNVTRALIVTLHSSEALTKEFLRGFLGVQSSGPYEYGMQTALKDFPGRPQSEKRRLTGFVLAISPGAGRTVERPVPQWLVDKVNRVVSDKEVQRKRTLQNALSAIGKEEQGHRSAGRLEPLLGRDAVSFMSDPRFGDSDLRYIYDLTSGSRPDALIVDKATDIVVLLENKIHGGIVDVQIERHIRENFGEHLRPRWVTNHAQLGIVKSEGIPVCICSWRTDIYPFFKSFQKNPECHGDSRVGFLVDQFLRYLEANGMGELRFNRNDFLQWESYDYDTDSVRNLLDRIEALGRDLADHLGEHRVNRQNISRNYLGVNIWHERYEGRGARPVNVPHWSLGIQQRGAEDHSLRLFVQCESKELGKLLLKNRQELQRKLTAALQRVRGERGVVLRVMEKSHLIQGGKGENEGVWNTYFSFPLELCMRPEDVEHTVAEAFEAMTTLHDPRVQKKRVGNWPDMPQFKGKTIVGVLQLNYQLNWLELERIGTDISVKLERMVEVFRPYYDVLLKVHSR